MAEGLRGQDDALWQKLKDLPTLFQLDIPRMVETNYGKTITKLRSEKRQVPEEFDEDVRSENLLAFLLLYIDRIEEAKPHIDSVLRKTKDDPNLVALGNICAYYLKQYNVSEAKNYLQRIDMVMKENAKVAEDKTTIAIGEQGYCLSRLGPKCHLMAAGKFREALGRGPPDYQLEIKWNYGLALCLDRYLDRHNFTEDPGFKPTEVYEEAKQCLALVTESDIQALCGKGWVTLGEVHSKYERIHHKYFEGNNIPEGLDSWEIDECFEVGLSVAKDDHFVLERVGRHYRHRKLIDKAIECLEKANEVRPSAFSWHHLGLAYRSKARASLGRNGQGSTGWRGRRGSHSRPMGNRYDGASPRNRAHWYNNSTTLGGGRGGRGPSRGGRSRRAGPRSRGFRGGQGHFQRRYNNNNNNNDGARSPELGAQSLESGPCSGDVDRVQRDLGRMTLDYHNQSEANGAQTHPHDAFLEKAKECLEKAYELSEGTGVAISVGLAEILMQMGKHEEALEHLRKAINKDTASRSLEAASCYQKWGECFLQMGQEENGKNMLRKAVESAAKVDVEKKGAFATLVTLMQEDFRKEDMQADHVNELARLYELVSRNREALDFRKTALKLKANDPTTLRGLVDNLRAQGDYTQARMYLSMLRGLTDVEVPTEVVIEVNLGAAELQTQQDPHLANDIFLETFDFVFPAELHPDIMYNVFVYSDEEDRESAEKLTILCEEQYDLTCRCVHRDIPCTASVVEMVADFINKSTCVIFVISKASLQTDMTKLMIGITVRRNFGNLVTVNVEDCDLPTIVSVYPSIEMQDCFTPIGGVNTNLFRQMISTNK